MISREQANRIICEKFGFHPKISWQALNADETGSCLQFESEGEGEEWLKAKHSKGLYTNYHIGFWARYPDCFTDPVASDALLDKLAENWWWEMRNEKNGIFLHIYCNDDVIGIRAKAGKRYGAICLVALRSVGVMEEVEA